LDQAELAALRDALDALLKCPDVAREQLVRWFTPEAAKPNGHDSHHPARPPTPRPGKARRHKPPSAAIAERKLLEAMKNNPNMSVIALADAAGSSRSAAGERLRQMALRGLVEKDLTGRWKLKDEEPRPPDPPRPSPN
jgi:hypothetical protein